VGSLLKQNRKADLNKDTNKAENETDDGNYFTLRKISTREKERHTKEAIYLIK
jgi:uncharacterized protein Yka (UPF0111/DUF47 family)